MTTLPKEARKVQKAGKSTHIVSLPKRWVERSRLQSGDMVFLMPQTDGTLLLYPRSEERLGEPSTLTIDITGLAPDDIQRRFIGAYLAGCEIIRLTSKKPLDDHVLDRVHALTTRVIGPQVIDESGGSVTFRVLVDTGDFTPAFGIRRMHALASGMLQSATAALRATKGDPAARLVNRDSEVDKLYWLVAKQCNLVMRNAFYAERVGLAPVEAASHLLVSRALERIADHAVRIGRMGAELDHDEPAIASIEETTEELVEVFGAVVSAYQRDRLADANDAHRRAREARHRTEAIKTEILARETDPEVVMALAYIADSLERVRAYCADIAEAAVDQHFVVELIQAGSESEPAVANGTDRPDL